MNDELVARGDSTLAWKRMVFGYGLILCAACLWGGTSLYARVILRDVSPMSFAQAVNLLSTMFLLTLAMAFRVRPWPKMTWSYAIKFLAIGAIGYAWASACINYSISKTNAPTAITLQYVAPGLVVLWMWFANRQRPTMLRWVAIACTIVGCMLCSRLMESDDNRFHQLGIAAAFAAALGFAIWSLIAKTFADDFHPFAFTAYVFLASCIAFAVLQAPWTMVQNMPSTSWLSIILFSIVGSVGPATCFFAGLRFVPPTVATILCAFEIPVAALGSAIFLNEPMSALQGVGAGMLALAVLLIEMSHPSEKIGAADEAKPASHGTEI